MDNLINLEKLTEFRDKGMISEAEYEEQKRILFAKSLRETGDRVNPKSGVIYILLAWFLGTIGIHNFYAGYVARGMVQLFLTLLSPLFLFIPLIVTAVWAFAELLFQNKSRDGKRFSGSRKLIWGLRIGAVIWFVTAIYSATLVQMDMPIEMPTEELVPEDF